MAAALGLAIGPNCSKAAQPGPLYASTAPGERPGLLTRDDTERYRRIFELQRLGDLATADREIGQLGDRRLLGHVLHDRYTDRGYKASYSQLAAWLRSYADQPGADDIYRLALKRKARRDEPPRRPVVLAGFGAAAERDGIDVDGQVTPRRFSNRKIASLIGAVDSAIKADAPGRAEMLVETSSVGALLDTVDYDRVRTAIAARYFYLGDDQRAFDMAAASASRSGHEIPRADWIAGMAAWRLGRFEQAGHHFETLAYSRRGSSWTLSAASYWAARVHLRTRSPAKVAAALERAARYPYTFYGMIARRTLGLDLDFQWSLPTLTDEHRETLAEHPAGRRAVALLAAGQRERAGEELALVDPRGDAVMTQALLAVAEHGGMPALAMKIAQSFKDADGGPFDAGLYPIPPWTPRGGFAVDRALVYALMRQESRFNPSARSPAGAAGLMQLMPGTAAQMARMDAAGRSSLLDPRTNVNLGQRYISTLLSDPDVGGNLFLLTSAYNAGPLNAVKWRRSINDQGDPLLFIETIPFSETRAFIERVLANYWMYRTRLRLDTNSLTAIAAGGWPLYDRSEDPLVQIAEYEPIR